MNSREKLWVYPKTARLHGDTWEMRGSHGTDRVMIVLDRDLSSGLPADPADDLEVMRPNLQEAAQRLLAEDCVSRIEDNTGPQYWHWQIIITKADLA